jgi:hypothetical protein
VYDYPEILRAFVDVVPNPRLNYLFEKTPQPVRTVQATSLPTSWTALYQPTRPAARNGIPDLKWQLDFVTVVQGGDWQSLAQRIAVFTDDERYTPNVISAQMTRDDNRTKHNEWRLFMAFGRTSIPLEPLREFVQAEIAGTQQEKALALIDLL